MKAFVFCYFFFLTFLFACERAGCFGNCEFGLGKGGKRKKKKKKKSSYAAAQQTLNFFHSLDQNSQRGCKSK